MSREDYLQLLSRPHVATWRLRAAEFIESRRVEGIIVAVILFNALILGLETNVALVATHGRLLVTLDKICLGIFLVEILVKISAYRWHYFRNGWNWFDFLVVGVALVPGAGVWAVLRSLRVLRVLRLLTVIPSLRKVVLAFLHAIPGLAGVMAVMAIFFYTAAVLATKLFGGQFDAWFGSIGRSLYSLFQIMTLESWSMGIVRPVMEVYPMAWLFFVPFIIVATFTILNLFIGIIVSTMQELATAPEPNPLVKPTEVEQLLTRLESDLAALRKELKAASGGSKK